jgi:alanine racemase
VRPTWAEVDLGAVADNVRVLAERSAPAEVCAVVKADGYGHGAVPVSRAAMAAGATWLAVALVEEAAELRESGIDAPILMLSEPRPSEFAEVVALGLRTTLYTAEGIAAAGRAATGDLGLPVHLKVDTGMHRVGAPPAEALALARAVADEPGLRLEAVWTHCAVADEPERAFTAEQSARLDAVLADLAADGIDVPMTHAANSAAAIAHPPTRRDLVRVGIAVYGIPPSPLLEGAVPLRPALSLRSEVTMVKRVAAGEGISYGLRHTFARDATVATVPVGYADGVRRRLGLLGQEVLVGGHRRPIVGVVTMDQLMVDCGDDPVAIGDEVVLIGRQGEEEVAATEWAERLGTIGYEITCGISLRVPRRYV